MLNVGLRYTYSVVVYFVTSVQNVLVFKYFKVWFLICRMPFEYDNNHLFIGGDKRINMINRNVNLGVAFNHTKIEYIFVGALINDY